MNAGTWVTVLALMASLVPVVLGTWHETAPPGPVDIGRAAMRDSP